MTTYAELQDKAGRALQDPDHQTFEPQMVKDMLAAGWREIGQYAPERFQEDLTPIADTLSYRLRAAEFPDAPNDDIEVYKVEIWDASVTPNLPLRFLEPQSSHPMALTYSQVGWQFWNGSLYLPNRYVDFIGGHETNYIIRVWGYSPWAMPVNDSDVVPFSAGIEEALLVYTHIEAMRRLLANRVLFTQWQTRSNNTDVTPAALMNDKSIAQDEWRRLARSIYVPREAP
jgi:hypothetical protein